jgi:Yip1 domain
MTEPLAPPTPAPVTPETPGGFFQNLIDVYFSPREAFTRIVRKPSFVLPLVAYLVLVLGFTGVWMSKIEPREFMKMQLEESGQWDKLQAEQREAILERAPGQMKIFGWLGPIVFTPLMLLVTAAALLFIFRFFYASEVVFKQAFAIVAWCFFALGLVTTPLLLLVLQLKGDWNVNPQDAVQANLGLLLDKSEAAKPLWALFTSIDAFSLWLVFLLAAGFGVASRKTTGSALWGVAIPWLLIVLVKVGWAALF